MFRVLILATLIPALLATHGIEVCRSGIALPIEVIVADCDQAPCTVALGQSAQVRFRFTARKFFLE